MWPKNNLEFFNDVKGKKIRWDSWSDSWYFIPEEFHLGNMTGSMTTNGHTYTEIISVLDISRWTILDSAFQGNNATWAQFKYQESKTFPNSTPEANVIKCTCNSRDLFNFGCKCGAIEKERNHE